MTLVPAADADVIVVGAGPAGSSTAYHLAAHGLRVLLLEKSRLPREKVCGDGLTPRAVRQLLRMGVDITADGWQRNRGLRLVSGRTRLECDWPESTRYPDFGLTRTREDFDALLAARAVHAGARLHTGTKVLGPERAGDGRVRGVHAVTGADERPVVYRAPTVVAADGASARLALALGIERCPRRPLGVALRRYYRSAERHDDPYLEMWMDLREPGGGAQLPGYGWIFGLGDGRVNAGLGILNRDHHPSFDLRQTFTHWLARTPAAWGLRDEGNADGRVRSAALPMGFSRSPHYRDGVLLVGDAGGMINPCNGEGITYALEAGELAAEVITQALSRPEGPRRERVLHSYRTELHLRYGRYYRLGNTFSSLVARPAFLTLLTRYAVRSPATMRVLVRILGNLTDGRGDALEHAIDTALRAVPAGRPR
ncbi:geranylgeranyl reductase family protein [Streptomyces sp. NPDC018031]|uniref:geranylgeranyl reductase family protein n=1 Tax=Streptomyces sp. NPDC018031 TaxID=3365033 RepID=UPI0037997928